MTIARRDFLSILAAALPAGMAEPTRFLENLIDSHGGPFDGEELPDLFEDEGLTRSFEAAGSNFFYGPALRAVLLGSLNLLTEPLEILGVMSESTAPLGKAAPSLDAFRNLDEYDGSNYRRLALANVTGAAEGAGIDCSDLSWKLLGPGSRGMLGFVIATVAAQLPVIWIGAAFHHAAEGAADLTITWPARGFVIFTPELVACGSDFGSGEVPE